ncbi:hypothetical protein J0X15_11350 [Roseibium sp. CAU 1637]|uniref:DUF937 domain-containing protein n=1 Tax=Roseibium limicola TaxID=2816037 RepID=A0A939J8Z0_9HYPH|nr:hypothetical protein [Roseibium limicola]MBO0345816.1 hypothetical protein [Roseibium limicola]
MKDNPLVPFAFDPTELVREAQSRFGWSETELGTAMSALLGAAMSGMQASSGMPGMPGMSGQSLPSAFSAGKVPDPMSFFQSGMMGKDEAPHLALVYGPAPMREAIAVQISTLTGLQRDAIMDMMPVAATLAVGQIARPYVPEEARELLDAFMRGFARGRPKPQPTASEYMQGYSEAVQSFWTGFMRPFSGGGSSAWAAKHEPPEDEPEDDLEDDLEPEPQDEISPAGVSAARFDTMVNDWMTRGRELQLTQFNAFESLFDRSAKDPEGGSSRD